MAIQPVMPDDLAPPLSSPDIIPFDPTRVSQVGERMTLDELADIIDSEVDDARDWIRQHVSPIRKRNMDYLRSRPFGTELEGRNQVISSDVYQVIHGILPQIERVLFGTDDYLAYAPRKAEDSNTADLITRFVQDVVLGIDNPGYIHMRAAIEDSLVGLTGYLYVWWDDSSHTYAATLSGLTVPEIQMAEASGARVVRTEPEEQEYGMSQDGRPVPLPQTYTVDVTYRRSGGQVRFKAIPYDEVLVDREASLDLDEARFICWEREITVSEAVEMGYDKDEVMEFASESSEYNRFSDEVRARKPQSRRGRHWKNQRVHQDDSSKTLIFRRCWMRVDYDGDGIAELREVESFGNDSTILRDPIPIEDAPISVLSPIPEAHNFFGTCPASQTASIQFTKSHIERAVLDSLAEAIDPTLVYNDRADVRDVNSSELSRSIHVGGSNVGDAVMELRRQFLGAEALGVIQYYDGVREERTGFTKDSAGLRPDALQSSTHAAVQDRTQLSGAQVESMVRALAESGLKRFYRLILKLLRQNQDFERHARVGGGRFITVEPEKWAGDEFDVIITQTSGTGLVQDKITTLNEVKNTQEQILQQFGMENPLTSVQQYENTLRKLLELAGIHDSWRYFKPVPPEWDPPPPEPPKPTPQEIVAQNEVQKTQLEAQKSQLSHQQKMLEMKLKDDLERDKLKVQGVIESAKLETDITKQVISQSQPPTAEELLS